ncbi:hypothetical protein RJT34_24450 [Clitoria ternatea]|uniref:Uncharacterized protein n=1 Tax=Clitoria ternatea TaxID=43366 RepID=A0AAN9II11_CLITE
MMFCVVWLRGRGCLGRLRLGFGVWGRRGDRGWRFQKLTKDSNSRSTPHMRTRVKSVPDVSIKPKAT